jgi:hypothetical protein
MDDWWDVDVRAGFVRGQRTGRRIQIGDVVKTVVVKTDIARRELNLSITKILGRGGAGASVDERPREDGRPKKGVKNQTQKHHKQAKKSQPPRGGGPRGGGRQGGRRRR